MHGSSLLPQRAAAPAQQRSVRCSNSSALSIKHKKMSRIERLITIATPRDRCSAGVCIGQ